MRHGTLTLLIAGLSLSAASVASAGVISISPAVQSMPQGNPATIEIVISGLGTDQVGDFDITIAFNPSLAAPAVTFGSFLGGPLNSAQSTTTGLGTIELAEISFLDSSSLAQLQTGSFTIATLLFANLTVSTPLTFTAVLIDDANGAPLAVTTSDGLANAVPEPGSVGLALLGLGLVTARRWKRMRAIKARDAHPM